MKSVIKSICYFWKKMYLKCRYHCIWEKSSVIDWPTKFEGSNKLARGAVLKNSYIGYASYLAEGAKLVQCYIGRYTCIGPYVSVAIGRHPIDFVSIHPAFFSMSKQSGFTYVKEQKYEEFKEKKYKEKYSISIGNDVWIGSNAILMDGVKIGDGAIIGAGTLVTKDVEPYAVVMGVPGKIYKYRFDKQEIDFLLKLKWWDKDQKWIQKYANYFDNINDLKERIKEG